MNRQYHWEKKQKLCTGEKILLGGVILIVTLTLAVLLYILSKL